MNTISETCEHYKTDQTCNDKAGQPTDVLTIETDPLGLFGELMMHGNPFTIDDKGGVSQDKALLTHYLDFMANIDLTSQDNLKAVGFTALGKARRTVSEYFKAMAGISRQKRRSDGQMTVLIDPAASDKVSAIIGHLLNPQGCGQPIDRVERLNFRLGRAVIDSVAASNKKIAKAQDG